MTVDAGQATGVPAPVRVLIVDDSEDDALLLARRLRLDGIDLSYRRVDTVADLRSALEEGGWSLAIVDYHLPGFTALDALRILQEHPSRFPRIVVSGVVGEERAAEAMQAGADDYVLKDNLTWLVPAVRRELHDSQTTERARLEEVVLAARTLAHHVNNHLSLTVGFAEMLALHPELPEPFRAWAQEALRGAQAAAETLAKLQQVTRLEHSRAPMGPSGAPPLLGLDRSRGPALGG